MVPGMHHCGGGPGPASFGAANQGFPTQFDAQHDIVMALDRWVETGVAPDKIIASHLTNKVADRTLPLCPYPQLAAYNGSGEVKSAESYRCEAHDFWWSLENFPGLQSRSSPQLKMKLQSAKRSSRRKGRLNSPALLASAVAERSIPRISLLPRSYGSSLLFLARLLQIVERNVVLADHLHEFPVGLQLKNPLAFPGMRVSLRIVDRDVHHQRIVLRAA